MNLWHLKLFLVCALICALVEFSHEWAINNGMWLYINYIRVCGRRMAMMAFQNGRMSTVLKYCCPARKKNRIRITLIFGIAQRCNPKKSVDCTAMLCQIGRKYVTKRYQRDTWCYIAIIEYQRAANFVSLHDIECRYSFGIRNSRNEIKPVVGEMFMVP